MLHGGSAAGGSVGEPLWGSVLHVMGPYEKLRCMGGLWGRGRTGCWQTSCTVCVVGQRQQGWGRGRGRAEALPGCSACSARAQASMRNALQLHAVCAPLPLNGRMHAMPVALLFCWLCPRPCMHLLACLPAMWTPFPAAQLSSAVCSAAAHAARTPLPALLQVANAPGAKLSSSSFSRYWINYDNGCISVGRGEPGEALCASWTDPEPIENIRFAGGVKRGRAIGGVRRRRWVACGVQGPHARDGDGDGLEWPGIHAGGNG